MSLLPSDPKKRRMALLGALGAAAVLGLGFFVLPSLVPSAPEGEEQASSAAAAESAVRSIERDLKTLREELKHDFYKTLKPYQWTPDSAAPGKANPFAQ